MITISIDPILLNIGHFAVRWYGLIITVAVLVGLWIAGREAERYGFQKDDIYSISTWVIAAGLIGARLFHVIDHWPEKYAADPIRVLYIWEGGLAIWGAVLGGIIAVTLIARLRSWRLPRLLDTFAPGLVLAQAIGRTACIITGDAMGPPTNGPFGVAYTNPNAMVPRLGVYYTPMPVYEIFANLAIFAVLWKLRTRNLSDGRLFLIYLSLYSLERFLLGFTSAYRIIAFGLTQSQLISVILLSLIVLFLSINKVRTSLWGIKPS